MALKKSVKKKAPAKKKAPVKKKAPAKKTVTKRKKTVVSAEALPRRTLEDALRYHTKAPPRTCSRGVRATSSPCRQNSETWNYNQASH